MSPRPIGWIGTKSRDGVLNLAPYSFFAAIADRPPLVMFSSSGRKDSQRNAEETGVFTTNLAGRALLDAMNLSSVAAPSEIDEFALAGLTRSWVGLSTRPLLRKPMRCWNAGLSRSSRFAG